MLLMEEAERIALQEHGSHKISVISGELYILLLCLIVSSMVLTSLHTAGVGTRNYYRKIGYELDGPYMSKNLH